MRDRAIVVASGLPDDRKALPYTRLARRREGPVRPGRDASDELTTNGGFTLARIVGADLRTFGY